MQLSFLHPFILLANALHNSFVISQVCVKGHSVSFRVIDFAARASCDDDGANVQCDLHYKAWFVGSNESVYFNNKHQNNRQDKTSQNPEALEYIHTNTDENITLKIQFIDVDNSDVDIHKAFIDADQNIDTFSDIYGNRIGYVWQDNHTLSTKIEKTVSIRGTRGTIKPVKGREKWLTMHYEAEIIITHNDCPTSTISETTTTTDIRTTSVISSAYPNSSINSSSISTTAMPNYPTSTADSVSQTASTPTSTRTRSPRVGRKSRKRPCIN